MMKNTTMTDKGIPTPSVTSPMNMMSHNDFLANKTLFIICATAAAVILLVIVICLCTWKRWKKNQLVVAFRASLRKSINSTFRRKCTKGLFDSQVEKGIKTKKLENADGELPENIKQNTDTRLDIERVEALKQIEVKEVTEESYVNAIQEYPAYEKPFDGPSYQNIEEKVVSTDDYTYVSQSYEKGDGYTEMGESLYEVVNKTEIEHGGSVKRVYEDFSTLENMYCDLIDEEVESEFEHKYNNIPSHYENTNHIKTLDNETRIKIYENVIVPV